MWFDWDSRGNPPGFDEVRARIAALEAVNTSHLTRNQLLSFKKLLCTAVVSVVLEGNATAGLRSTTPLPYALVDVSADTIGFLSQPNLITFQGEFPDKRPKPQQVAGVGDVLNISIFEAAPGGLFTPATAAGARPGNFVDLPPQAVDQKGSIYVPYAGEIPAAARDAGRA